MKKKIIITGGTGLLGSSILKSTPQDFYPIYTFTKDSPIKTIDCFYFDLLKPDSIKSFLDNFQPEYFIHTAAIGSVDEAENNPEFAKKVNVDSVKYLVNECNTRNIKFLYISSNAVYDGKNPPYSENSVRSYVNYYGKLKIEAEDIIFEKSNDYIIIRPILMYGIPLQGRRDNPVTWWIKSWKQGKPVQVVNDTITQPLFVKDCANVCWSSLAYTKEVFNVAGPQSVSLFEFAKKTLIKFNFSEDLLIPVPSDTFKNIAPRPKDTSFNIDKIKTLLNIQPLTIDEGLNFLEKDLI